MSYTPQDNYRRLLTYSLVQSIRANRSYVVLETVYNSYLNVNLILKEYVLKISERL